MSWITSLLAVGGRFPMEEAENLARELSIRYIVDVRQETCDDEVVLRHHGIELLHLPTLDTRAVSMSMLDDGASWVREKLERNHRVYVHCEHGIGRSALLSCCVLVSMGEPPLDALGRMKKARIQVSPSPEQLEALIHWCGRWRKSHSADWEVPNFQALADIAYSHLRQGGTGES